MISKTIGAALVLALAVAAMACGEERERATADGAEVAGTSPAARTAEAVEGDGHAAGLDEAELAREAAAAVKALAGPLKAQLQAAMRSGGPAAAVDICHQVAPEMARAVSAERGVEIRRVSSKHRNPVMGEPNEWQAAVLRDFEARRRAGEEPGSMRHAELVGDEYRFMKAIPTDTVCLRCHGSDLAPEVVAILDERYPEDQAVGYREGDIRGAFVVTKRLGRGALPNVGRP